MSSSAPGSSSVRPTELFAALSLATDLGSGLPLEHALMTCLVSGRLAAAAGASPAERATAHHVALLHAIGCTSNAHETAARFGDDLATRAAWATLDPGRQLDVLRFLAARAGAGAPLPLRLQALAEAVSAGPRGARENFAAHCEVAVRLAGRLGLGEPVRAGLLHAFERWDGRGFPRGVAGEALPPAARLLHVARDAHAIRLSGGPGAAVAAIRARGGGYDPAIAARLTAEMLEPEGDAWAAVVAAAPAEAPLAGDALDEACAVAGDFADLKSPWTLGHSAGVAELAEAAAWRLGLADVTAVRRAGRLHDLGRVGVSSAIWDRAGPLSAADRERVRLHPLYTERTLARCPGLAALGRLGAAHHERLDGSGYHRGCGAGELDAAARTLAAADAFHAMTEARPHRPALAPEAAAAELAAEARAGRLDARCARLNPALNAFRTVRRDAALAEADAADARLRAGERASLLGLPVAIKDNLEVAGELATHGTGLVREPAREDCEAVRRLRAAGAVVLGLTTMPGLALWPHATDSPAWGVTRNPHDPSRSPGGSSGGSAVAVAAGLAAAALGTDGGGSIRVPAAQVERALPRLE